MKHTGWFGKLNSWVNGDAQPLPEPEAHRPDTEDSADSETAVKSLEAEEHDLSGFALLKEVPETGHSVVRVIAALSCIALLLVLLLTVAALPRFGSEYNAPVNETSARYIEKGVEEVGATNLVANIILVYRGFDTYGESCVLFLGATSVIMLLACDRKNTSQKDRHVLEMSNRIDEAGRSQILGHISSLLMPVIVLYGLYILCNGHLSPGGGFAGGSILGGALILCENAFGAGRVRRFFSNHVYHIVKVGALIIYAALIGWTIYAGANGMPDIFPKGTPGSILSAGIILPVNVAVGLEVACTMYAFYTYFGRGDL